MTNYRNVTTTDGINFQGEREHEAFPLLTGAERFKWVNFSGTSDLMKLQCIVDDYGRTSAAAFIWMTQDGYGQPGFNPGDWSGVRDSSPAAIAEMVKVADEFARVNVLTWPWLKPEAQLNIDRKRAERVQRWEAIANDYGTSCGREVPSTDIVEYPMQIMSLLSDVQEMYERDMPVNDHINAAKLMLSNMIKAAREAERAS